MDFLAPKSVALVHVAFGPGIGVVFPEGHAPPVVVALEVGATKWVDNLGRPPAARREAPNGLIWVTTNVTQAVCETPTLVVDDRVPVNVEVVWVIDADELHGVPWEAEVHL